MTWPNIDQRTIDYYDRYSDPDVAIQVAREDIDEWDYERDPDGYCHRRPVLVTLVRLAEEYRERSVARPLITALGTQMSDGDLHDPSNKTDYGWTPWIAPLTFGIFGGVAVAAFAAAWTPWTLIVTLPILIASVAVFWRHQRHLPGVTSYWHR